MKKITLIFVFIIAATFSWQSNAQVTEDFESGLGSLINNASNDTDFVINTALFQDGAQSITNAHGSSETNILETAVLDLSALASPKFEFWHIAKTEGNFDECLVEISIDGGATYGPLTAAYEGDAMVTSFGESTPHFSEDSYTEWGTSSSQIPDNTWWKLETFDLANYAVSNVKIRFRLESDSSANRAGWSIDNVRVYDPPCVGVSNIDVTNIMQDSVDISWVENNITPSVDWEYVVQADGVGEPTGAGTAVNGTSSVSHGSLSAATSYEIYVRSNCLAISEMSEWNGPFQFVTACAPSVGAFTENFNAVSNGALPNCWASVVDSTDASASVDVQGSNVDFSNESDTAATLILVSPELTELPNAGDTGLYRMRFKARGSADTVLRIGTMDVNNATGTFTTLSGFPLSADFAEYYYSFSASATDAYVGFKAAGIDNTNANIEIEDVSWELIPTCIEPHSLMASDVSGDSVTMSWTHNANDPTPTEWEYVIQAPGTGVPAGTGTLANSNPFTDMTLSPVEDYEYYVRSKCGANFSTWVGPVTFTTPCAVMIPDYTQDFSSYNGFSSSLDCWGEGNNTDIATGPDGSNGSWDDDGFVNSGTSGSARFNFFLTGDSDWLVSPEFDLSADGYELSFDAGTTPWSGSASVTLGSDDTMQLLISDDGGTTWIELELFDENNSPSNVGDKKFYDLTATHTSANTKFAFLATEGAISGTDMNFYVDNFIVRIPPTVPPGCATVTGADTTPNCGDRGATISWPSVQGATGYNLSVGTSTGGINIVNNEDIGSSTTFDFESTPGTEYFFTVLPYNEFGPASGCTEASFTSFATGCVCISDPTSNDGNGVSNVQIGATNFASSGDVTYEDHTGTVVDLAQDVMNNVQVTFETGFTYDTNIWIDLNNDMVFDNDTELFYIGESTGTNPTTLDASFELPSNTMQGQYAMRIGTADSGQQTPNPCFNGSFGVTLDFIVNVLAPPTCLKPSDIVFSNITSEGADIAWMDNNSTAPTDGFDVYVATTGSAAPNGATTPTADNTTNPYTSMGGSAETVYDVYVRADCGLGDTSAWSGPATYTTTASCVIPEGLIVDSFDMSAQSATIHWTDVNVTTPTGWEYELVDITAGGTATGTATGSATGSPKMVFGLVENNEYEVLIRANCSGAGDGFSEWSTAFAWTQMALPVCPTIVSPADAATDVAVESAITFAWAEGTGGGTVVSYDFFAGLDVNNLNFLGNVPATTTSIDLFVNSYGQTVYWKVVAKNGAGDSSSCDTWSFTTEDQPGCGDVFTDFRGASENYANNSNDTYVFTPDNGGDVVTVDFTAFDTQETRDGFMVFNGPDATYPLIASDWVNSFSFQLPTGAWSGTGDFAATSFTSSDVSGALTFVFTSSGFTTRSGWEADISCGAPPVCVDPTNGSVVADEIRDVSVQLTWDENNTPEGTSWDIEYGPTGFTQGSGVSFSGEDTNPYLLTGLVPVTTYDYYVRTACSLTYKSGWAGPFTFTTDAVQTCFVPTNGAATNITTDGADLSWTAGPFAVVWNIEYGQAGFTIGDGTSITTADNPYASVTGLMGFTDYDFYVQSVCSLSDVSYWAGPFTFKTLPTNDACEEALPVACGDVILGDTTNLTPETVDAGHTPDSEAANSAWYIFTGDGMEVTASLCESSYDTAIDIYSGSCGDGNLTWVGGNDDTCGTRSEFKFVTAVGTDYYIKVYGFSGFSRGAFELALTCETPCTPGATNQDCASADALTLNGSAVSYDSTCSSTSPAGNPSCDPFGVIADMWYTVEVPNSGELNVTTVLGATDGASEINVALYEGADCGSLTQVSGACTDTSDTANTLTQTGLTPGATYYIRTWNSGEDQEGNFSIEVTGTVNPCALPTDMAAANMTVNSADLSWTENDLATTWDIKWGESGFDFATDGTTVTATGDNPYALTGLSDNTTYDFYVRSLCEIDSEWTVVTSFTTTCLVPTDMAAADVTATSASLSWTENSGATTWDIEYGATGFTPGDGTMVSATTDNPYVLTGLMSSTAYDFYVMSSCSDWSVMTSFTTLPSCLMPSNLGITGISDTSVDLTWDENNGATAWNIEWDVAGFTQGDGNISATSVNPFTISGIDSSTVYEFYVQAICSSSDASSWAGPFQFTTYAAGLEDLASFGFNHYPNPVANSLTMTATKDITSVSIYNVLGQEVYTEKLSTLEATVDMTKLASGSYYVKAQVGQAVGTFKVIKK